MVFMQVDDRQLNGVCINNSHLYRYTLKSIKLINKIVFKNSFKGINYKLHEMLV